jgi:hypothetical protein
MQKSGVGKSKKKGKSLENEPKSLKELLGDL